MQGLGWVERLKPVHQDIAYDIALQRIIVPFLVPFGAGTEGFFMNWFGQQAGESYEYFLLWIAISASLVISGGGRYSVDGYWGGVRIENTSIEAFQNGEEIEIPNYSNLEPIVFFTTLQGQQLF